MMKAHIPTRFGIGLTIIATTSVLHAQTAGFIVGNPQATVRGGASANLDIVEAGGSGDASGVVSVKFSTSLGTARKHYVRFDLTGYNPNTNGPFYLRYDTAANSGRQDVQVWSLDQDYPGFSANLTWNTAQANDTSSGSGLLSSGPLTATPYQRFLSSTVGNVVDATHQMHGPWGHMIRSGNVIYLALSSVADINANGLRFTADSVELGFDNITTGTPPSLGVLPNIVVFQGQTSVTNAFTVGDPDDGPNGLTPIATSSNAGIVDPANIFFEGTGANRTVHVIGGNTTGTATVVVSLTDADGNLATRTFTVTVQQINAPPVIVTGATTNSILPLYTLLNTPVVLPFAVADAETANSELTVSATIAPYSEGILQSATLSGNDYNTNLSVTVTPQPEVDGVGVVRLSVSDTNGNTTTVGFCVMVRSNASVVFVDRFDYQSGNILTEDAPNLWTRRNTAAQTVYLRSATSLFDGVSKVAHVRPNAGAEDLAGRILATYGAGSRAVLYTRFTATFADLTGGNTITNVNGESPFFRLSFERTATTDFTCFVAVQDLSDGVTSGEFTFLTANGVPAGPFTQWPANFQKPEGISSLTKTIITRYDVATAKTTLWLDATTETDPHIGGSDAQPVTPIGYVGLFQERGNGDIYIDDMTVSLVIKPLITSITPPVGGNLDIDFAAATWDGVGDFIVERAPVVTGPYQNVAASISALGDGSFRATVAAPSPEGYYKVKRTPVAF
jgi:hypothetical protein